MDGLQLALFAFLAGLTFAGLAGSALELLFRRPVSLGMLFVPNVSGTGNLLFVKS